MVINAKLRKMKYSSLSAENVLPRCGVKGAGYCVPKGRVVANAPPA